MICTQIKCRYLYFMSEGIFIQFKIRNMWKNYVLYYYLLYTSTELIQNGENYA